MYKGGGGVGAGICTREVNGEGGLGHLDGGEQCQLQLIEKLLLGQFLQYGEKQFINGNGNI